MVPRKHFQSIPLLLSIWVMASNNTTTSLSFDPGQIGMFLIVLGLILIALEAASPGYFVIIPGTIILILGVIGVAAPGMFTSWYTPVIIIIVGAFATLVTLKFYQIIARPVPTLTPTTRSMVGKEGIIIKETDPDDPTKGRVRVAGEDWAATSDEPLPRGTKVVVVGGEGVHLYVKKKE